MTGACLKRDWELVVRDNRAYIERVSDRVPVAALFAHEAICAGMMDGSRSDESVDELMFEIAGEKGRSAFKQVKSRLASLYTNDSSHSQNIPLDQLASVDTPSSLKKLRPLPGPKVLHWWVTDICPRRCVYCFANPKHGSKALDSTIRRHKLNSIFKEASSLGATKLLIAGGEPLLRDDLPEILGDAIKHGIDPGLTTKYPISSDLAGRLANAGLTHICLSVDSFSPDENLRLVGFHAYGDQVRRSARHLREKGVLFSFEIVLTQLNYRGLDSVIAECANLGAVAVQVVPFEPVLNTIGDLANSDLILPYNYDIDQDICYLQSKYSGTSIQKFVQLGEERRSDSNCDIGITKLFFTQNGSVHRCYKLLGNNDISGSNLGSSSVAEIWHSLSYNQLIQPSPTVYFGSDCYICSSFAKCNGDGRCIFKSYVNNGAYYSQDRDCGGPY